MRITSHSGEVIEIPEGFINAVDIEGKLSSNMLLNIKKYLLVISGQSEDDLIDDNILAKIFELAICNKWTKVLENSWEQIEMFK